MRVPASTTTLDKFMTVCIAAAVAVAVGAVAAADGAVAAAEGACVVAAGARVSVGEVAAVGPARAGKTGLPALAGPAATATF